VPFIFLLLTSTIVDWFIGRRIYNERKLAKKKYYLLLSLMINLGLLSYFKYANFILVNIGKIIEYSGFLIQTQEMSIVLPVGISFYTFQTLSYSLDIYKGKAKPWNSFLDYSLFVSFFPQLVAGPIVRSKTFLPQCKNPKKANEHQLTLGLSLFIMGLFNKVVVADTFMAPIVETVYDSNVVLSFFQAWAGTVAFSVQIFCDFAGYSSCAIGVALMLGFYLPLNFHSPYASIGFSDFWRRWHISLSSWLRDYLYITLGGNRRGIIKTYANIMLTMLIGGLWHGASWLFVIWGGLHGVYIIIERVIVNMKLANFVSWDKSIAKIILSFITYLFVCIAWVFFRATDLLHAKTIISAMLGLNPLNMDVPNLLSNKNYLITYIIALILITIHWLLRERKIEESLNQLPWKIKSIALAFLTYLVIISMSGGDRAFIYFQF
jgi:alginate O-acetyltransferase complex protein AlgI